MVVWFNVYNLYLVLSMKVEPLLKITKELDGMTIMIALWLVNH